MIYLDIPKGKGTTTILCPMCETTVAVEFWADGRRWANGQLQVSLTANAFEDHFGPCLDKAMTEDGVK